MTNESLQDLVDRSKEVVLGDGKTYKVIYTMRAFLAAEDKLTELGKEAGSFYDHSVSLWAALLTYHPEMTLDDVIELYPHGHMSETIKTVAECILEALGSKKVEGGPSPLIGPSSSISV